MKYDNLSLLLPYAESPEYGEKIAIIFSSLDYENCSKYFNDLFSWIEDINTPGAMRIFEYLKMSPAELLYDEFKISAEASLKMRSKSLLNNLRIILFDNLELQKMMKDKDPILYSEFVI